MTHTIMVLSADCVIFENCHAIQFSNNLVQASDNQESND